MEGMGRQPIKKGQMGQKVFGIVTEFKVGIEGER
jgi:hypothetical protein